MAARTAALAFSLTKMKKDADMPKQVPLNDGNQPVKPMVHPVDTQRFAGNQVACRYPKGSRRKERSAARRSAHGVHDQLRAARRRLDQTSADQAIEYVDWPSQKKAPLHPDGCLLPKIKPKKTYTLMRRDAPFIASDTKMQSGSRVRKQVTVNGPDLPATGELPGCKAAKRVAERIHGTPVP
ncbi:hypothetical protein C7T94_16740 [Pedobacter yulinensis]|uniref:Uncharacterized protein n=1 Tax=Pedobacter yulinensis TaxID=2126353 RepID=A0A2T3HJ09_9SPHI|nr:hypothetical protein [Pedobacter yulinensis]PST82417.1 hypothetical protein C7T94_16740 [Pedobacter yulinensis]